MRTARANAQAMAVAADVSSEADVVDLFETADIGSVAATERRSALPDCEYELKSCAIRDVFSGRWPMHCHRGCLGDTQLLQ